VDLLQKLGVLCAAFTVASCAPVQPRFPEKFQEVQIPPERISQKGFSLVPLNETGWVITGRSASQLVLGKFGKTPEENVVIRAVLFKLPPFKTNEEFVRLIKEAEAKNINPERLKLIKHEFVADPNKGTDCTKSHMAAEDHAAAKKVGKTGVVMVQEALTLTCAHPKDKAVGINVGYSHRYYPEQPDPRFLEKATSVLNSVEFADL
jgi:hypothetical protein